MKTATSELCGPALRYAVCLALGYPVGQNHHANWGPRGAFWMKSPGREGWTDFRAECQGVSFDTDWLLSGRIIDREDIQLLKAGPEMHLARIDLDEGDVMVLEQTGPTKLIAAMRCFVAAWLGEALEIPQELLS